MKKIYNIFLVMLGLMLITGCGASKLSDKYDEEKLTTSAEEIIINLNNEKYDDIIAIMDETLKDQLPKEKLEEAWRNFKKLGEYESISKIIFREKDGYAVVVAIAEYEEGKIQFTLSYNEDMELAGIYLK